VEIRRDIRHQCDEEKEGESVGEGGKSFFDLIKGIGGGGLWGGGESRFFRQIGSLKYTIFQKQPEKKNHRKSNEGNEEDLTFESPMICPPLKEEEEMEAGWNQGLENNENQQRLVGQTKRVPVHQIKKRGCPRKHN